MRWFVSLPHACRITQKETLINGKPAASDVIINKHLQDYSGWCRSIFRYSKYDQFHWCQSLWRREPDPSPTGSRADPSKEKMKVVEKKFSSALHLGSVGSEVKGQVRALSPVLSERDIILLHGLDLRVSVSIFLLFNWDKRQSHTHETTHHSPTS